MAKYSRKEFAAKCGITLANLSTYVKRHKVVVSDDNTIDDTNPSNEKFLNHRLIKLSQNKTDSPPVKSQKLKGIPVEIPDDSDPSIKKIAKKQSAIELAKSEADLRKKVLDGDLQQLKVNAALGNSLSIELVKKIVSELSRSLISNYKEFAEQTISEICHTHKITADKRVALVSKLVTGTNRIHEKAVNEARIKIKNSLGKVNLDEDSPENDQ